MKRIVPYILIIALCACNGQKPQGSFFPKGGEQPTGAYDLDEIIDAGSIIVGTLSGPDSYFEMGDEPMGVEYALAQDFASSIGVALRMEISNSEEELLRKLANGEIDLAAYPLPLQLIKNDGLRSVVERDSVKKTSWAVAEGSLLLYEALKKWEAPKHEREVVNRERLRLDHHVVRTPRPQFISRERGVLSGYDDIFREAAQLSGTDWRLLAAVSYVESRFDPLARSSAGAVGVMQLMPGTARSLGVADATDPRQNINGGARYLKQLTSYFADVKNADERLKFVLAAYNAGSGHIRDAMMLARKYGKNPHNWTDVSEYILQLSRPEFYRDPLVRHGYMRGTETYNYVPSVLSAYSAYGGRVVFIPGSGGIGSEGRRPTVPNRFTKGTRIISADDSTFTSIR